MIKNVPTVVKALAVTAFLLTSSACSTMGVQAWERDVHAKPEMALDGDSVTIGLEDHTYFSKESSSGGRGFGGGGCGCN